MTRRTKIVATVGPASESADQLRRLFEAGVDVVRLNLSHGSIESHLERLALVREVAESVGRNVGVLADLPGPKIRSGEFPEGGVFLEGGSEVMLVVGIGASDAEQISVEYDDALTNLEVGDRIVLGDGAISLRIVSILGPAARVIVETSGRAQGRPGVHLPSERTHLASPTEDDLVLAEAVAAAGVDFIAVSFVRTAADMERVREVVGTRAHLVAKIETSAAVANLDGLVAASDAVMVARGDLGMDCPLEELPHLQKKIVRTCVEHGVPVITATQMLESMITAPSPTRAEVTDIANAVFDGTDAVMLSGETAIGHDPALAVATMARVAERAERAASYRQWATRLGRVERRSWGSVNDRVTAALTHAAWQAAIDVDSAAILCCTNTGRSARAMARFRPESRLVALSPSAETVRRLTMTWGVDPIMVGHYQTVDEIVWHSVERAVQADRVHHGDTVVVLAGSPDRPDHTAADVMRIVHVD